MNGLMLHAGAQAISRHDLELLPDPLPLGPRHNSMPFHQDVELITNELQSHGLSIIDEAY